MSDLRLGDIAVYRRPACQPFKASPPPSPPHKKTKFPIFKYVQKYNAISASLAASKDALTAALSHYAGLQAACTNLQAESDAKEVSAARYNPKLCL